MHVKQDKANSNSNQHGSKEIKGFTMAQRSMQVSFNSGEWSPYMYGRYDIASYSSALKTMENMIPLPQGITVRRPGTVFVTKPFRSGNVRLVPYEPNSGGSFVIELGDKYVRILNDYGPIYNGNVEVWIDAPWSSNEVSEVTYTQCGDRLYFWHKNHRPTYLVRVSTYVWRFDSLAAKDGPWLGLDNSGTSLVVKANHGYADVMATKNVFSADDIGRDIRVCHDNNWGWATITQFYNPRSVQVLIRDKVHSTSSTSIWRWGAWSKKTGYPSCGAFIEDRLIAASSILEPRTIWASKTADHENFAPTNKDNAGINDQVEADNSITMTLSDDRVQKILWLQGGSELIAGTTSGEFVIRSGSSNGPMTPFSINARRETTRGVSSVMPERVDHSLLYVDRSGRQLHEMVWDLGQNAYTSQNLALLADHLLTEPIAEIAQQSVPWNIIWIRKTNGKLIAMTWDKLRNINAWHRHSLGENYFIENIITVTGDTSDTLWLVISRTIAGRTERYIERLSTPPSMLKNNASGMHYVDCGYSLTGNSRTQQSGLIYPNGTVVDVLADGKIHNKCTVNQGSITLSRPAKTITIGFHNTAKIETLDGFLRPQVGKYSDHINIHSIELNLTNSAAITVEKKSATSHDIETLALDANSDKLFSGIYDIKLDTAWYSQDNISIYQNYPLPMNIIGLNIYFS